MEDKIVELLKTVPAERLVHVLLAFTIRVIVTQPDKITWLKDQAEADTRPTISMN